MRLKGIPFKRLTQAFKRRNFATLVSRFNIKKGENIMEEVTQVTNEVQNNSDSYFDGGVFQLLGWKILGGLVTGFTLGICYPFAVNWLYSWEAKHTVIEGRRLKFTGSAGGLFGTWLKAPFDPHNPEAVGSSPTPAIRHSHSWMPFLF